MKGYPIWFSPYTKPSAPFKPKKELTKNTLITQHSATYWDKEELIELVDTYRGEEYYWSCEIDYSGYDHDAWHSETPTFQIEIRSNEPVLNLHYEQQMVKYKEAYAEYQKKKTEWNILKKKYDEERAEKQKQKDLKLLAQLEEKYKVEKPSEEGST